MAGLGKNEFLNLKTDAVGLEFAQDRFRHVHCQCFNQFPASPPAKGRQAQGYGVIINRLLETVISGRGGKIVLQFNGYKEALRFGAFRFGNANAHEHFQFFDDDLVHDSISMLACDNLFK